MKTLRIASILVLLFAPSLWAEWKMNPVWMTYPIISKASHVEEKVIIRVKLDPGGKIIDKQAIEGAENFVFVAVAKMNLEDCKFYIYSNSSKDDKRDTIDVTYEFVLDPKLKKDRMEFDFWTNTITITALSPLMQTNPIR